MVALLEQYCDNNGQSGWLLVLGQKNDTWTNSYAARHFNAGWTSKSAISDKFVRSFLCIFFSCRLLRGPITWAATDVIRVEPMSFDRGVSKQVLRNSCAINQTTKTNKITNALYAKHPPWLNLAGNNQLSKRALRRELPKYSGGCDLPRVLQERPECTTSIGVRCSSISILHGALYSIQLTRFFAA